MTVNDMNCPHCGHPLAKVGLTPRQKDCRDFILNHTEKHGSAPTYQEICEGLGLRSKSQVTWLIGRLEERGAVVRLPFRQRTLRVVR